MGECQPSKSSRYYVPEVGRFASPDTIVPDPSNPQSFNRYSYVNNSPTRYTDPSGHDPLGSEWRDEFEEFHNRQPAWYDEFIRLFSIAYPDEWSWSNFYNPDGTFKGFGAELVNPPVSRSWDSLPDALARLGTAYTADEKDLFARDVGFLYAGMPARSQNPGWRGHRPYYSVGAFGENPPLYLQRGSLPEGFFVRPDGGRDADFNVHHWAWAFTVGYEFGIGGIYVNHAREYLTGERIDGSDLAAGSFGVYSGIAFTAANFQTSNFPEWFSQALQVDASWYAWPWPLR